VVGEVAKVEGVRSEPAGDERAARRDPDSAAVDICVEIDVAKKKIRINASEGLLELNETQRSRRSAVAVGRKVLESGPLPTAHCPLPAAMKFDIVTIFPRMTRPPRSRKESLAGGIANGVLDAEGPTSSRTIRPDGIAAWTMCRRRRRWTGMVMSPSRCAGCRELRRDRGRPDVRFCCPPGRRFTQAEAVRVEQLSHIALLCGRYRGWKSGTRTAGRGGHFAGDYVVSGGELPP